LNLTQRLGKMGRFEIGSYDNSYSGNDGLFLEGDIDCLNPQAFPVVTYLRVYAKVIIGIR
jgi:hypothetical protein